LSAVIEENWVCRGLFRVGPTRYVGQDLATFGDVGDMSPTCRRHVELSGDVVDLLCVFLIIRHPILGQHVFDPLFQAVYSPMMETKGKA